MCLKIYIVSWKAWDREMNEATTMSQAHYICYLDYYYPPYSYARVFFCNLSNNEILPQLLVHAKELNAH